MKNTKRKASSSIKATSRKPKGITSMEDFICAKKKVTRKARKK